MCVLLTISYDIVKMKTCFLYLDKILLRYTMRICSCLLSWQLLSRYIKKIIFWCVSWQKPVFVKIHIWKYIFIKGILIKENHSMLEGQLRKWKVRITMLGLFIYPYWVEYGPVLAAYYVLDGPYQNHHNFFFCGEKLSLLLVDC